MDTIYITGHRNPDTDSIVSSMAYAALKNALGQRQYQAARLGQISDETQIVLDRFGFQPPRLLTNVRTQVRDLDYDTPATLSAAATISRAWRTMQKDKISAIPVANPEVEKQRRRIKLEGEIPSPINAPKGCKFCTRCSYAKPICFEQPPELKECAPGHRVACHVVGG